ncbi:hypothetical protein LEP1GSC040_1448 [Leptospira santarosai str. 2000030832]|nr:hypothetical protein LEP1GSC040_1448 [Leptospira santarosai str. 2000030832]
MEKSIRRFLRNESFAMRHLLSFRHLFLISLRAFQCFPRFLCSWSLSVSWECGSFSKNDSTEIYPEIG